MFHKEDWVTRRLRVLVVDNDRDSADSLGMLARLWGHEVCVVYGGLDALAIDPKFLPDVMLLDLAMPVMDGNRLARKVRQLVGREDVLLIAVTGHGMERDCRESQAAGFDHLLLKPVDPLVIESLLRSVQRQTQSVVA